MSSVIVFEQDWPAAISKLESGQEKGFYVLLSAWPELERRYDARRWKHNGAIKIIDGQRAIFCVARK